MSIGLWADGLTSLFRHFRAKVVIFLQTEKGTLAF